MEFFVKHYGREPVDNFAPMSLVFVQKKLVEHGYARPVVNKYVGFIVGGLNRQSFEAATKGIPWLEKVPVAKYLGWETCSRSPFPRQILLQW
jgi:hypothetical protein